MNLNKQKALVSELFAMAGIYINGKRPWDIQVRDSRFYNRVLGDGSLGLGEAYMDGWWDCTKIDEFIARLLKAGLQQKVKKNWTLLIKLLAHKILNFQTKNRALKVGKEHYDIGNNLYKRMLDEMMNYSCGYWNSATNLDQAQHKKLELISKKLDLKRGMKLLDIGCGWGAMAKYAAQNYGVEVVGVTISEQQRKLAQEYCHGLPVTIRFQDYRDVSERFDRIVSIGMFEHVGYKNYREFMRVVSRCLKDDGIFLLHTIGSNKSNISTDAWINKYIFPNSMLPSIKQIGKAIEGLFVMEDWHNLSANYDKTLMAWHCNFNQHWEDIKVSYDDRFYRMWNYYLLSCAAFFRVRNGQLWQIVLSKQGIPGGYQRIVLC